MSVGHGYSYNRKDVTIIQRKSVAEHISKTVQNIRRPQV